VELRFAVMVADGGDGWAGAGAAVPALWGRGNRQQGFLR